MPEPTHNVLAIASIIKLFGKDKDKSGTIINT